ncbi:MAG: 30S ribosomal protein S3 [Candidatus Omnitrophica bacterium]|nr:30S ribosomal protein S3 [Candidatus Omnitrophota bacterium]
MRIGISRTWHSRWFAKNKDYKVLIAQDYKIRKHIASKFKHAAIADVIIERLTQSVRIKILTAKPGIIIGRHGADIEKLREDLNAIIKQEVSIDIVEVKNPSTNANLLAQNVAGQIEKRVAFRRAVKRSMEQAFNAGAKGVKIICSGRLNGAEIARTESYRQGKIPLHTLRADIDYGFAESFTTYGLIGIKVWIYKGDILDKMFAYNTHETEVESKQQKENRSFKPHKAPVPAE